jgi:hypothetical protein
MGLFVPAVIVYCKPLTFEAVRWFQLTVQDDNFIAMEGDIIGWTTDSSDELLTYDNVGDQQPWTMSCQLPENNSTDEHHVVNNDYTCDGYTLSRVFSMAVQLAGLYTTKQIQFCESAPTLNLFEF